MSMLSIHRPRPSMEIRTPASCGAFLLSAFAQSPQTANGVCPRSREASAGEVGVRTPFTRMGVPPLRDAG